MSPRVSIGLPVFNGERYLCQTVDSLLAQDMPDFELIISDNASTDQTPDICHDYARRDSRIRYFRQRANLGAPRNFNFVLHNARGTYFKWAAAGDLCAATLLRACGNVLDTRANVVVCFAKTAAIDEHGHVIRTFDEHFVSNDERPSRRYIRFVERFMVNNVHAGLFRSHVLRRTKPEQLYPGADVVRMAELTLHGAFYELPQVLLYRRYTAATTTTLRTSQEVLAIRAPGAKCAFRWPRWRNSLGHCEAVLRSPIRTLEKFGICWFLLKGYYWQRHALWRELAANL